MGMPSFFRWLVDKYPNVVVPAKPPIQGQGQKCSTSDGGMEFDNLYLDMNGIIHPCFHPEDQEPPTTFDEVFQSIFEYIDWLFGIVRPKKLLFMAIDGVAPRAKMNQQRSRRFRTAKDAEISEAEEEILRKEFESKGKKLLPKKESEVSDSNIITPGTCFMDKLARAIEGYICTRLNSDPKWKNVKVILSDANASGEGEHKIMNFIRLQRSLKGYDPNTRHCLYGLDADLIMLALATHEPHFSILREDVLMEEKQARSIQPVQTSLSKHDSGLSMLSKGDSSKWRPKFLSNKLYKKPYQFLNIWTLREYLEIELQIPEPPFEIDFERIVDDFIFICFFTGNDFLPHMPTIEIRENAIDLLMAVYKDEFKSRGGYLINVEKLDEPKCGCMKFKRIEKFILSVGTYEERIFKKRMELKQCFIKKLYRQMADGLNELEIEEEEPFIESSIRDLEFSGSSMKEILPIDQNDVMKNTKELKERVKEKMLEKQDLFKQGILERDKVRLGTEGWKEWYYKEKFSVESTMEIGKKRKEIVQKYIEGLYWVLQYYFCGVRSWSWFYPYHHGPFASDLKGLGRVSISLSRGDPFKPFEQLMGVLPPRSFSALPKVYWPLMTSKHSKLIDFYPADFEVDVEGKRHLWQGIVKLPFIDEKKLRSETQKLENDLEEDELKRNSQSREKIFVLSTHGLSHQIISLYKDSAAKPETEVRIPIDANASGGMNGFISPCSADQEWSVYTSCEKAIQSTLQEHVLYATYEYPDMHSHIPRLLENVILPEKTVVETDIVKRELWHEYEGHRPPASRFQIQDKYKKALHGGKSTPLDSLSAGESHKSVGSGWSARRGKGNMDTSHFTHYEPGRGCATNNVRPVSPSFPRGRGHWSSGRGRAYMEASWRRKENVDAYHCTRFESGRGCVPNIVRHAPSSSLEAGHWKVGRGTTQGNDATHCTRYEFGRGSMPNNVPAPPISSSETGLWNLGRGTAHVGSSWNGSTANLGRGTAHVGSSWNGSTANLSRGTTHLGSSWNGSTALPGKIQSSYDNCSRSKTCYAESARNPASLPQRSVGASAGKWVPDRGWGYVESPGNQPTSTANAWKSTPAPVEHVWTGMGGKTDSNEDYKNSGQWCSRPGGNWVAEGSYCPPRNSPKNGNGSRR